MSIALAGTLYAADKRRNRKKHGRRPIKNVFVDYADCEQREFPKSRCFVVMTDGDVLLETDDWNEVLSLAKQGD